MQYLNHVAHGIGDWLKTPGRVAQHGMTPEDVEWGPATALGMVGGGAAFVRPGTIGMAGGPLAGAARSAAADMAAPASRALDASSLASGTPRLYNPPSIEQRPISADYPNGTPTDDAGRITHTIEGTPIDPGDVVVGRAMGGDAAERALEPQEVEQAGTRLTGQNTQAVPQASLPEEGAFGSYRLSSGERLIARELNAADAAKVSAHETGHVLESTVRAELQDRVASNPRIEDELRFVYNDLNNPDLTAKRQALGNPGWLPAEYDLAGWRKSTPQSMAAQPYAHFGPENNGYVGAEVDPELFSEAFRAYLHDPNYMKSVAPNLARAMREIWNENPVGSKVLKLNSIAAAGAVGGLGGGGAISAATLGSKDRI